MQIDGISGTNSITGTNKTQSTSSIKQDTGGQIINQTIQAMNTGSTGQSNASFNMQTKVLNASLDSAQGAASSTSTTSPMFDMQTKVLNASLSSAQSQTGKAAAQETGVGTQIDTFA